MAVEQSVLERQAERNRLARSVLKRERITMKKKRKSAYRQSQREQAPIPQQTASERQTAIVMHDVVMFEQNPDLAIIARPYVRREVSIPESADEALTDLFSALETFPSKWSMLVIRGWDNASPPVRIPTSRHLARAVFDAALAICRRRNPGAYGLYELPQAS